MSDPVREFEAQVEQNVKALGADAEMIEMGKQWLIRALENNYAYNFNWMGRPLIQAPTDMYALQELIWKVKPDLIIEAGIAHGGSLIFSASMLALLDYADAMQQGAVLDPAKPKRKVLGIDIEIRPHNKAAIEAHPMAKAIEMLEGSSIAASTIEQVQARAKQAEKIMVVLDSNHTHEHVLAELNAYAPLVSKGSYCVVMDTGVEDLPEGMVTDRPWGKGNNPKTAVWEFLEKNNQFEIDKTIEHKIVLTSAYDGFLKKVE